MKRMTGAAALLIGMSTGIVLAQQPQQQPAAQPAQPAQQQSPATPAGQPQGQGPGGGQGPGQGQQQPQAPRPYTVGNPLGMTANGAFTPMTPNVKVYGGIFSGESCSYDPVRNLIVIPSRGVGQNLQPNNGWVSLINHDGTIHTSHWIGAQNSNQRASLTPPLVLNEPFGSDIVNGVLYVADRDGGTGPNDPSVSVVRRFTMATGAPAGEFKVEGAPWFNDIAVARDGTVYGTVTGGGNDPNGWQIWKITPDGKSAMFIQGAPLRQPNGIAIDGQGNLVIVNMGTPEVQTFSATDGKLMKTENAAQAASDGIVIMPDGTKYVSSVFNGGISRIRPGQQPELIAQNVPNAASMCYDPVANQLVIPMHGNNALGLLPLR